MLIHGKWHRLLGGILLCLPVLYTTLVLRRPTWDESLYHLPELSRYGLGVPEIATLRGAGSAVGPLFYVLSANLSAPFGGELVVLRLLVFACAAGSLLLFGRIVRESGQLVPAAPVLLLISYPYFFTLSGLFMSEMPALFAGLGAFFCYLRWQAKRQGTMLTGYLVCSGLAVLFRQYFGFLPLGLAAHELLWGADRRWYVLLLLAPLLLVLPSLLLWGGLVPPVLQARHSPGFSMGGLVSFLVWTGVYGLPWLWMRSRRTSPGTLLLPALLAVPAAVIAPEPGPGVVRALFELLPSDALPVVSGVAAALGGATCIVLARGLFSARPVERAGALSFFAFGVLLAVSGPVVYERYFLPAVPLLLVGFGPDIRPGLEPDCSSAGGLRPVARAGREVTA